MSSSCLDLSSLACFPVSDFLLSDCEEKCIRLESAVPPVERSLSVRPPSEGGHPSSCTDRASLLQLLLS